MSFKLIVEIVDKDKTTIADVLELIIDQIRQGFYKGFDETTKEINEIEVSCNYTYQITDIM